MTTVIAAESTRRETFGKLLGASLVTVALYWVAHAYAHHWGERMAQATRCSARQILVSLRYEASIFAGAAAPLVVLLVAWLAGASLVTAVTTVLWCAAAELLLLEVVPGVRHRLPPSELAVQALVGLTMGIGVLVLRVVLH